MLHPTSPSCKAICERYEEAGYWWTDGQAPWGTIHSAIIREIADRGGASRFAKVGRGLFARAA